MAPVDDQLNAHSTVIFTHNLKPKQENRPLPTKTKSFQTMEKKDTLENMMTSLSPSTYDHFNRTEMTRLLLQTLRDLNYTDTYYQLLNESKVNLNDENIENFLRLIQKGSYDKSLVVLHNLGSMLVSSDHTNLIIYMTYLIRRLFFLECLYFHNEPNSADLNIKSPDLRLEQLNDQYLINYLRNDLNDSLRSLNVDDFSLIDINKETEIHQLTSLIMNFHNDELLQDLKFKHNNLLESRHNYVNLMISFIKPEFKLPNERLLTLLRQSIKYQQTNTLYHLNEPMTLQDSMRFSLISDFNPDKSNFPSNLVKTLDHHENEVWYVKFSNNGKYLASCSLDKYIIIYDVLNDFNVISKFKSDKPSMYCSWSSNDNYLLSCGLDTVIRVWDVPNNKQINSFVIGKDVRCWTCNWLPNNESFIVGSQDKFLRMYNLNGELLHDFFKPETVVHHGEEKIDNTPGRINDLTVTPDGTKLITINYDKKVHIYDIVKRKKIAIIPIEKRLTNIVASQDSTKILVNVSPEELQLWDINKQCIVKKYLGQQQPQYVIRGAFGNYDESVILSGSEDGKIYIWDKESCNLIFVLNAHNGLANSVDWNKNGYLLGSNYGKLWCSAGDDKLIKVWGV